MKARRRTVSPEIGRRFSESRPIELFRRIGVTQVVAPCRQMP
jgi:hypothetical protein